MSKKHELRGSGEFNFQSNHVIRFKCPVLNKEITRHTKQNRKLEKYGSFKGNKLTKSVPEKDLMAELLNKDLKATTLTLN